MRHNPSSRRSWLPPAQQIEEPHRFSTLPSCHLFLHPIALMEIRWHLGDREDPMIRLVLASLIGLVAVLGIGQTTAKAQPESCPQHFVGGTPPALLKP